jgi:hypothetical protein
MRGRSEIAIILLGTLALAFDAFVLYVVWNFASSGNGNDLRVIYVMLLANLSVYSLAFLCKWRPERSWNDDANSVFTDLWNSGMLVDRKENSIDVQLNRMAILRYHFDKANKVTYCQAEPTQLSNIIMLAFFLSIIGSPAVVLIAIYVFLVAERQSSKSRDHGPVQPLENPAIEPGIGWRMIETLTEMRGVCLEALEATRAKSQDSKVLALVGSLFAWLIIFFPSVFALDLYLGPAYGQDPNFGNYLFILFWISVVLATLVLFLMIRMVNRMYGPLINDLSIWSSDLSRSLDREIKGGSGNDDESTIEVILRGWSELPVWLEIRRRAMAYQHPATTFLMTLLAIISISFLGSSIPSLGRGDYYLGFASIVVGIITGIGLVALYEWQTGKDRDEKARSEERIRSRVALVHDLMEKGLEEL